MLDHPKAVKKLMLLDICPTLFMYETTDREFVSSETMPVDCCEKERGS